jgi:formamidopyrimidine-DNA glycosylase
MTGKVLWNAPDDKFTRAILELDNGTLVFHDIRQFGRFEFFSEMPAMFSNKGPDALTVDFETFYARLKRYRGAIKAVLLNQLFVAGIGNIYADEILFAARIHPRKSAAGISRRRAQSLHQHTLEILQAAVQMGGSSISNYVDALGKMGDFQTMHRVYGRTGEQCPECGKPVRRIVIAQRGTHYCPHCQRG